MRLRRNPRAKELVSRHPRVVGEPERIRGKWRTYFGNDNPIHVELGTGKGRFLSVVCGLKPAVNWIGVERIEEVLLTALKKSDETECDNLRFLWTDVARLAEIFAPGEVDRLYLHFSDPWPKRRHAKRRLTHRRFLALYRQVLKPGGHLLLKTDSRDLYQFTLEELEDSRFRVLEKSEDLHRSPYAEENIMTEYEEKFVSAGLPIYYVLAEPLPLDDDPSKGDAPETSPEDR
ncbi:tRNA (guanosine(46)-N7)-methyltransferase TrmB [Planifilum fimeticola]|jgi:tRNA (guanine-N7-)-methyltransferase